MARCGRCGMWEKTPPEEREQKYAGTCLWYGIRLEPEVEYDDRDCGDFVERIPPHSADWHFQYKIRRENLRDAYLDAQEAKRVAKRSNIQSWIAFAVATATALWEAFAP